MPDLWTVLPINMPGLWTVTINLPDLRTVLCINLPDSWTHHKSDGFVDSDVQLSGRFVDSHNKFRIFVDSLAHTTLENLCSYAQHINFLMRLSIRGQKNLCLSGILYALRIKKSLQLSKPGSKNCFKNINSKPFKAYFTRQWSSVLNFSGSIRAFEL